jgi:hypothetical protein
MKLSELNPHRPWPLPTSPWIMSQVWRHVTFLHWAIEPSILTPFIPQDLILDTYQGKAWISYSCLNVYHAKLRFVPPVPGMLSFNQINIRTYVRSAEGKPGVYFLKIGATNRFVTFGCSTFMHLPFVHNNYQLTTAAPAAHQKFGAVHIACAFPEQEVLRCVATPVTQPYPATAYPLTAWLTERYSMYTDAQHPFPLQEQTTPGTSQILIGEITHHPWTLQDADITVESNSLLAPYGFDLSMVPTLVTYTKELKAYIWGFRNISL